MVKLKISDIALQIREQLLTEEEREVNSVSKISQRLNKALIESGDLTECVLGKIETALGSTHGIGGELRTPADGNRYWIPLYTSIGYKYVIDLFIQNRRNILDLPPKKPKPIVSEEIVYRYSRTVRKEIQRKYRSKYDVVLLEGPYSYWAFDEDAQLIGSKLNIDVKRAKNGFNLTYNKNIHELIVLSLSLNKISCVIVHPSSEEVKSFTFIKPKIQVPQKAPIIRTIKIGVKFKLVDEEGIEDSYIILEENVHAELISIQHADGTTELIRKPSQYFEGCIRLSPSSELASAIIGASEGEYHYCCGERYLVKEIIS